MIIGVGTDILKIQRVRDILNEENAPFLMKVFTAAERAEAKTRNKPDDYFATRFAGKEAVFKCFGEVPGEIRLNEIEILCGPCGKPNVHLSGSCLEHARVLGIKRIYLSLSYDGEYAVAFAVAEGRNQFKNRCKKI